MPRLLDLFCKQGGASAGYERAGFEVTGVDKGAQPRYPFAFIQGDAIEYLKAHGHEYDAVAASPPCQAHTNAQKIQGNEHLDLIPPTREALIAVGKPYVMENVPGAPLEDPVTLCGAMFGLNTYRHRLFEPGNGFAFDPPEHPAHAAKTVKMGRRLRPGDFYHAVGNFTNVDYVREDMNVPWMSRDGIRECIPPAYTEYIGKHLMAFLMAN
jgi:DNA (cytosine-5)-methyltransferase 1